MQSTTVFEVSDTSSSNETSEKSSKNPDEDDDSSEEEELENDGNSSKDSRDVVVDSPAVKKMTPKRLQLHLEKQKKMEERRKEKEVILFTWREWFNWNRKLMHHFCSQDRERKKAEEKAEKERQRKEKLEEKRRKEEEKEAERKKKEDEKEADRKKKEEDRKRKEEEREAERRKREEEKKRREEEKEAEKKKKEEEEQRKNKRISQAFTSFFTQKKAANKSAGEESRQTSLAFPPFQVHVDDLAYLLNSYAILLILILPSLMLVF